MKAGMHPEAVLSEKQKEIRFQKFIQKKKGDGSGINNGASGSGGSDKVSISSNLAIVPKSKTLFYIVKINVFTFKNGHLYGTMWL